MHFTFTNSFVTQAKGVTTVAVGIGHKVKEETLKMIAGAGNPMIQVAEFSKLVGMIDTIKSSVCSGKFGCPRNLSLSAVLNLRFMLKINV